MERIYRKCILILSYFVTDIYCNAVPTARVYDKANMFALAVRIRSKILQPFGHGTDLLSDMKNYIKELDDLTNGVNEENPEALGAFNRIINQGGPLHILLRPVDTKSLAKFYKWDDNTMKMFQDIFELTLQTWNDLQVTAGLVENKGKDVTSCESNF